MGSNLARISEEKLRQIFDQYGGSLALYARQWSFQPEDALQEGLIELAKQDPEPIDSVAWLFKAVRFRAINLQRAEQRRGKHQLKAVEQQPDWFEPDMNQGMESDELQSVLNQLPQLDREILIARIWGERSFEEIASLVQSSTSTVHRRYQASL